LPGPPLDRFAVASPTHRASGGLSTVASDPETRPNTLLGGDQRRRLTDPIPGCRRARHRARPRSVQRRIRSTVSGAVGTMRCVSSLSLPEVADLDFVCRRYRGPTDPADIERVRAAIRVPEPRAWLPGPDTAPDPTPPPPSQIISTPELVDLINRLDELSHTARQRCRGTPRAR